MIGGRVACLQNMPLECIESAVLLERLGASGLYCNLSEVAIN